MFGRVMNLTRCLVVDECGEDRDHATALLQAYGYDVFRAETPEQALAACRADMPDMILVTDMAGRRKTSSLLMRLKAAAKRVGREPVILFCAGDHDPQSIGAAIVHGADDCIMKPFDSAILDNKLKQFGLA